MKKIVLALVILLSFVGCVSTSGEKATISVTGSAKIKLEPDVALFTVSAESIEETSEDARIKTSLMINRAIETLMNDFGVNKDDIKTNYIDISPYYEWQDNQRVLKGQRAGQSVDITLHDISKYGDVFSSLTKIDGISVSTASLDKMDKSKELIEVRKLAIEDAKAKAEAYAEASGVTITGILSIGAGGSSGYSAPNVLYAKAAMMDTESSTEFYSGSITVSDSVSVVYTIK